MQRRLKGAELVAAPVPPLQQRGEPGIAATGAAGHWLTALGDSGHRLAAQLLDQRAGTSERSP